MTHEICDGSVKTLWRVSLPLILSFLSNMAMLTIDRLFLAGYSASALSAAASAGVTAWAMTFGGQSLTNIAGVFVAQHNGAGRTKQLGRPVWQMVWLSLVLSLIFAAAGIWLAPVLFAGSPIIDDQVSFYRWTMGISPLICMAGALNGFFSGRGRTQVITWATLLANGVNLLLDPILIFGWGPIPSYGIAGACFATGVGLFIQVMTLFYLFLKREEREHFGTGDWLLRPKLLWDCVRIGGPESLSVVLELSAWGAFYVLLGHLSAIHILVASVGQSLLMAFFWFGIGLEIGVSSVAGNLIGRGKLDEVKKSFYSGIKIVALFGAALFACFFIGGERIIDIFLKDTGGSDLQALSAVQMQEAKGYLLQGFFVIGAYIVFESVRCLLYGVLRAAGDTLFILILGIVSTWLLLLLPTYQLMTVWKMPVSVCFWIWLVFAFSTAAISYLRFATGSWSKRRLTHAASSSLQHEL